MTDRGPALAKADVTIDADPTKVYGLITDLPTLASLAEENEAARWHKGDKAAPGAVFRGTNRNGFRRWTTTCTVTDAEPGRAFGFDVSYLGVPIAHWRYHKHGLSQFYIIKGSGLSIKLKILNI